MEFPDMKVLMGQYKNIIENEKTSLIHKQLESFVSEYGINLTKTLINSYESFATSIDNTIDMNTLMKDQFIVNLLKASKFTKEKDLKKLVKHFCSFVMDVGVQNSPSHNNIKRRYADNLINYIQDIEANETLEWIATLKERLDR